MKAQLISKIDQRQHNLSFIIAKSKTLKFKEQEIAKLPKRTIIKTQHRIMCQPLRIEDSRRKLKSSLLNSLHTII